MTRLSETNTILLGVILAFALWYFTFLTEFFRSFWYRVTFSSIILAVYAFKFDQEHMLKELKVFNFIDLSKGIIGGILLYIIFYIGYSSMRSVLQEGAQNVYLFSLESSIIITSVSLVITSFCEEFFWRAYIQRKLVSNYDIKLGLTISSISYALIHAPTMNAPLVLAALIAGFFWGILYAKTKNIWLVTTSHLIWTELIFVVLPLA